MNREPDFVLRATDEPHLAKVAPRLVAALRAVHTPGNSYETACAMLQIPIGTLKSRVHRARLQVMKLRAAADQPASQEAA